MQKSIYKSLFVLPLALSVFLGTFGFVNAAYVQGQALFLEAQRDIQVEFMSTSANNFNFFYLSNTSLDVVQPLFANKGGQIIDPRDNTTYSGTNYLDANIGDTQMINNAGPGEVVFGLISERHDDNGSIGDFLWWTGESRNDCSNLYDSGPDDSGDCPAALDQVRVEPVAGEEAFMIRFRDEPTANFGSTANMEVKVTFPDLAPDISVNCDELSCTFNASGSIAGAQTYSWSFGGDGTVTAGAADEQTVTYEYDTGDSYTVTLTVTDSDGDPFTDQLSIAPAVSAPSSGGSTGVCGSRPAADEDTFPNPLGNGIVDICGFLVAIFDAIMTIAVPIIILMIIYSGFLFISARGNQSKLEKAKNTFFYAIIGAAILLGAEVLANAIVNTLTGF